MCAGGDKDPPPSSGSGLIEADSHQDDIIEVVRDMFANDAVEEV